MLVKRPFLASIACACLVCTPQLAAQETPPDVDIPGGADVDRQERPTRDLPTLDPPAPTIGNQTTGPGGFDPPPGSETVFFTPERFRLEGAPRFGAELQRAYLDPLIGQEISVARLWELAHQMTDFYREQGYFLSRVIVPEQEIQQGVVLLRAVEGYVTRIDADESLRSVRVARRLFKTIKAEQPLRLDVLERALLLLNDIPGIQVQAVLAPGDRLEQDGGVILTLLAAKTGGEAIIRADNFGSRFLGPLSSSITISGSPRLGEETRLDLRITPDSGDLFVARLSHTIRLLPSVSLFMSGGVVSAQPGFDLTEFDLESRSFTGQAGLGLTLLRRRRQTLALDVGLGVRQTDVDLAETSLTQDRLRTVDIEARYSLSQSQGRFLFASLGITQGLPILGATDFNTSDASRIAADDLFTAVRLFVQKRFRPDEDWLVDAKLAAQAASGPLFSSQEFGYGGAQFGRAYDPSELVGDHGFSASVALIYDGWTDPSRAWGLSPYAFLDAGAVWNSDLTQPGSEGAGSIGIGLRFGHRSGFGGDVLIAEPLGRRIDDPLLGNGFLPQFRASIEYRF